MCGFECAERSRSKSGGAREPAEGGECGRPNKTRAGRERGGDVGDEADAGGSKREEYGFCAAISSGLASEDGGCCYHS